ncbi:claudin-2-like [Vanacampus margaritifer]
MASVGVELVGFFLGLIGLLGSLVTTVLPFWEVSVDIDSNDQMAMDTTMGLWMECVHGLKEATRCSMHKSHLNLSYYLQMSRILMVVSLALSTLGLFIAVVGMQCTIWLESFESRKRRVAGVGGCFLFAAGIMTVVPVSWTANKLIWNFSNIHAPLKFVPGKCLYLGIASAVISMLGGCMLFMSFYDGHDCGGRRGGYTYKCDGGGIPMAVAQNSSTLPMGGTGINIRRQTGVQSVTGSFMGVHVKPIGSAYDVTRYV